MSTLTSYDYVKSILKGCGVENLMIELMAILRNVVDEYAHGNVSEQELDGYISQLCQSIMELASRCGRPIALDICVNELGKRVRSDAKAGAGFSLLESFRSILKKKRTTTTGAGTPSILG